MYPYPDEMSLMVAKEDPERVTVATAPEPPPPVILTAGTEAYPDPPLVSVMPVITPEGLRTANAAAPLPVPEMVTVGADV